MMNKTLEERIGDLEREVAAQCQVVAQRQERIDVSERRNAALEARLVAAEPPEEHQDNAQPKSVPGPPAHVISNDPQRFQESGRDQRRSSRSPLHPT
mmetsp:Transcript_16312/g.29048  ORF Transcript_16312/g.29048 Transcript_16312/m.29048 type:complete len:97 (-) Transcript_16312:148-438(-)